MNSRFGILFQITTHTLTGEVTGGFGPADLEARLWKNARCCYFVHPEPRSVFDELIEDPTCSGKGEALSRRKAVLFPGSRESWLENVGSDLLLNKQGTYCSSVTADRTG